MTVRFRVDLGAACAIGPGKIALIEAIGRAGSLSQAARELRMSYRRAWLLLDSVNSAFRRPAVTLSTGGKGGGGATVTEFGAALVEAYRKLESDIESRARIRFDELARQALTPGHAPTLRRRALSRGEPAPARKASARRSRADRT